MRLQAHAQRAQAAQGKVAIVRAHRVTVIGDHIAQRFPPAFSRGHAADQHVGVAADVLGAGLDRQIHTVRHGVEEVWRGPGVVHQHRGIVAMRDVSDGRDVLHLEGQRTRRLDEHGARVGTEQRFNAGAQRGIEIGRLDTEALQVVVTDAPDLAIAAIHHQQMIAGLHARQHRDHDSRQPRWHQRGPIAAFQFGQGVRQCKGGLRAMQPVVQPGETVAAAVLLKLGQRLEQDGRATRNGRVHQLPVVASAAMGESCVDALLVGHGGNCRMPSGARSACFAERRRDSGLPAAAPVRAVRCREHGAGVASPQRHARRSLTAPIRWPLSVAPAVRRRHSRSRPGQTTSTPSTWIAPQKGYR